jgi:hypothetical protein
MDWSLCIVLSHHQHHIIKGKDIGWYNNGNCYEVAHLLKHIWALIFFHPCDLKNIVENFYDMLKTRNGQNRNNLNFFSIFEIRKLTSFFKFPTKKSKAKRY